MKVQTMSALYTFKEELEQSEDQQAKKCWWMYMTCWTLRRTPYELLCQIGNRSDKDPQAAGHAEGLCGKLGQSLCSPKPKTPEEKQEEKERQAQLGLPPSGITQTLSGNWGF